MSECNPLHWNSTGTRSFLYSYVPCSKSPKAQLEIVQVYHANTLKYPLSIKVCAHLEAAQLRVHLWR